MANIPTRLKEEPSEKTMYRITNDVLNLALAVYLGFSLTVFTDVPPTSWEWWAILIPTLMVVSVKDFLWRISE